MAGPGDVFGSRLGRRTVLLILLAGSVPLALFAAPIRFQTEEVFVSESRRSLEGSARLAAERIGQTIELARARLDLAAQDGGADAPAPLRRLFRLPAGEAARLVRGPVVVEGVPTVYLEAPAAGGARLVGEVDPVRLWAPTRPTNFGPYDVVYVLDAEGRVLAASTAFEPLGRPERVEGAAAGGDGPVLRAEVDVPDEGAGLGWRVVALRRPGAIGALEEGLMRALVLFFTIALLVLFLLSMRFARGITRPVVALVEATRRLAEGDWTARAPEGRRDEIGDLGRAFNRMTRDLQASVRERLRLEGEATIGRIASTVAHEVNNPLAAIKNRLGLVRGRLPGEVRADLDGLDEQIDRIARTVRSLLDVARRRALRREPAPVADLVRKVAALFEGAYRSRGISLAVEVDAAVAAVPADPEGVQEVLINLLENARQALAERGGAVRVVARPAADAGGATAVEVVVEDSGPGLGADAERVFEPFYTTRTRGTGLGLPIARRIAEGHGGSLRAENRSAAEGGGARFVLRLPLGRPADLAAGSGRV